MPKNVKIYSTPTCPYCQRTKQFLSENGIPYEDIDVSVDSQAAEEMIRKSSQMGVPVLDIEGQIIVGFNKDKIREALGI